MRRLWISLLTVCLALVTVGVGASTASAASAVTVSKIASKTAPYKGKATVEPAVSKAKGTKVLSKKLTVKQGSRTVAKNKTSVKLAAGTYEVTTTVKYKTSRVSDGRTLWSATKTRSRAQTLVIKAGKKPNHAEPYSDGECPSWAPVKGNADSGIYHVPGGRWYKVTKAEECFTSASAARAHGYRASRNG